MRYRGMRGEADTSGVAISCNNMSMQNPKDRDALQPAGHEIQPAAKKPYRKPAVRYERVFETMALACGKIDNSQGQCHTNRKVS